MRKDSQASIDPKNGFCQETKIYHSLRKPAALPPPSAAVSFADYVISLLHKNSNTSTAALIDVATHRVIPYSDIELRVKNLTASLRGRFNLATGDAAFILSPNSVHLPILFLSLFSLGVIISPSNPASSKPEVSRQIHLSKPSVAFATSETVAKLPALKHPPIILDSPEFELMMTAAAISAEESSVDRISVSQSDAAVIMYSSGTTGRIKGVLLTHRNLIATVAGAVADRQERKSPAVNLATVPYFHVYGFIFCVRCVAFGESVASMGRFDLRLMVRAIEEFRVTHLAVAPPVVAAMANNNDGLIDGCDLSSLEIVIGGGAPMANAVIEKFKRRFSNLSLLQAYGLTETTGGVARVVGPYESKIVGAVGRLISHCQAKIVDPDTGVGLPPMKPGELWIRGPILMQGYVDDKEATAAILDSEGWLRTGDLCYFDNEGFLFCVDRLKELIKYKGYQVPPAELEHILQSHPDIAEAAVIPYPDEEAGQVPMAFVVRRSGCTIVESEIKYFVAKQVAPYKKIRRVLFIDSIPKNATGKVLRKDLIKLALSRVTSKL